MKNKLNYKVKGGNKKMAFEKQQPAYSGDGIAIWEATIENGNNKGKTFLKVKVLGGSVINCFPVEKIEKKEE